MNEELRLQVGTVSVALSVKNLGVYFDTSLTIKRNTDDMATKSTELFCQVSHSHSQKRTYNTSLEFPSLASGYI